MSSQLSDLNELGFAPVIVGYHLHFYIICVL